MTEVKIYNKPAPARLEELDLITLGREVKDMSSLLEDKDAFLKCLTEKMLVYALGRPVVFGDRTLVRNIVGDLKQRPTLDTLIKAIVTSDAFQNKGQGEEE